MKTRTLALALNIFWLSVSAQNNIGKFSNFSIKEGLSQSTVKDIFQDKKGLMWFGTGDGLNKFDGKKFIVYKNNYRNVNSLSDNDIAKILKEDSQNNLWIFTRDLTINKFNLRTQQFHRYLTGNNDSSITPFTNLFSIEEDKENKIWITTSSGVFKFEQNRIKKYNPLKLPNISGYNDIIPRLKMDLNDNLWLLTQNGLYRYDYKKDNFFCYQLPEFQNNKILKIIEDCQKRLWIVTTKGLCLYNSASDKFSLFPLVEKRYLNYSNLFDIPILCDHIGNIWIGDNEGLIKFNAGDKHYHFYNHTSGSSSLSNNKITKIVKDKSNQIWIGTADGLNRYIPSTDNFTRYFHNPKLKHDNFISNIITLYNGEVWLMGSRFNSPFTTISNLNIYSNELEEVENNKCDPNSIANSFVTTPFIDNYGNLWLGTFTNGIIKYTPQSNKFNHYYSAPGNPKSLGSHAVFGFTEEKSGNILIALDNFGLSRFDTVAKTFQNFKPDLKVKKGDQYSFTSMLTDKKGNIWIATTGAGLVRYDGQTGISKIYLYDSKKNLIENVIKAITIDFKGKIWAAHSLHGIDIFDPLTETFVNLRHDGKNINSLSNDNVWAIAEDQNHNIWISSDGYIDCYNPLQKKFKHYKSKSNGTSGILVNTAICIYPDRRGNVWFGTLGGGLSMFDAKSNKFNHFTELDGLANNTIYGIVEDQQNNLWLSTNRGISKFNMQSHTFINYHEKEGVQSEEFNQYSFFKSSTNQIYFGGINGFNVFNPAKIIQDTIVPNTILTGINILGKEIQVSMHEEGNGVSNVSLLKEGTTYYLPIDAAYLKEISIPYQIKVFTLEFATTMYNESERCAFQYKMENFDGDWNNVGNKNFATYTNLPAGKYIFKLIAANTDGFWNTKNYELKITIVPPFWKAWWFITFEILLIILMVWFYIFLREKKLKRHKTILERKVKERTKQVEEKNEELRIRNIEISKQKEEITYQANQLKSEMQHQNKISEIALLRSQINPHFLFNTLNNIYSLVNKKSEEAPPAVMKLSELMRFMLYEANTDKVSLEKEINYLKSYIGLQLLRIKNNDFFEFNITGNIYGKSITPMIFIPFIENAFKHGNKKEHNPGILINLQVDETYLRFEISNYYQSNLLINKDYTGGIGLKNVRRRLELMYPNKHSLEISDSNGYFKVNLELTLL
jgi:ligand-binding sensor domain-containing protein